MKRIISGFLVIIAMITMFSGCVSMVGMNDNTKPLSTSPAGDTSGQGTNKNPEIPEKVAVEETVIYNENNIKVTVKEMSEGWTGPELKVLVENSTDKNISFAANEFIINGVTISGFGYVEAAAGKKSNGTLNLFKEELETAGITAIATIRGMDAHIVDTDSFVTLFDTPFNITTNMGTEYVQTIDDSGDVVLQDCNVTVISRVLEENLLGKTVSLLVKNETGKDIVIQAENVSVNGYTITTFMYDTVYCDTVRFCGLELLSSELESNEIEEINEVTFTLKVIDPETYDTIFESEEIQVFVAE